jgi:hypothetical protein
MRQPGRSPPRSELESRGRHGLPRLDARKLAEEPLAALSLFRKRTDDDRGTVRRKFVAAERDGRGFVGHPAPGTLPGPRRCRYGAQPPFGDDALAARRRNRVASRPSPRLTDLTGAASRHDPARQRSQPRCSSPDREYYPWPRPTGCATLLAGPLPRNKGKCSGILRQAGVNVVPALTTHTRNGHNRRSTQPSNVSFRERGDRRNGDGRAGTVILVLSAVAIVLMILLL